MQIHNVGKFCRDNQRHIDVLMDYFSSQDLDPQIGQQIMLFCAGMSAGLLSKPITGDFTQPLALGWQIGVSEADNV